MEKIILKEITPFRDNNGHYRWDVRDEKERFIHIDFIDECLSLRIEGKFVFKKEINLNDSQKDIDFKWVVDKIPFLKLADNYKIKKKGTLLFTKREFERMYLVEGMTIEEIAIKYCRSGSTISQWKRKFGINKRRQKQSSSYMNPESTIRYILENEDRLKENLNLLTKKIIWCEEIFNKQIQKMDAQNLRRLIIRLFVIFNHLNNREKEVINMRYFSIPRLKQKEVAEQLKLTPQAISSIEGKIFRKLKRPELFYLLKCSFEGKKIKEHLGTTLQVYIPDDLIDG